MAIFTVTTGNDVVDPNDGLLSLREAVALANASPGADTIVFAPNVSSVQANSSANRAPITITAAGGPLTIRGDHDNDGQADVVITNGFAHHLTVAAGAQVTIVGVDFRFGGGRGAAGEAGANGREGQQGEAGTVPPLTVLNPGETMDTRPDAVRPWGAHGGNARSADGDLDGDGIIDRHGTPGQAGAAGGVAGGSILNEGSLTIVRSGFGDNRATGGPGGAGGRGGEGAAGLSGARGNDNFDGWRTNDHIPPDRPPPPGNDLSGGNGGRGSDGGNGGRGGAGGAGGDAGAAITNAAGATLTLVDVAFGGRLASGVIAGTNTAQGGPGGAGGGGGNGGASGAGGGGGHDGIHTVYSGSSITYLSGAGGLGGDSGNAGSGGAGGGGGRGGATAGAVLNLGTVSGEAAFGTPGGVTAGGGGSGRAGGLAGYLASPGRSGTDRPDSFTHSGIDPTQTYRIVWLGQTFDLPGSQFGVLYFGPSIGPSPTSPGLSIFNGIRPDGLPGTPGTSGAPGGTGPTGATNARVLNLGAGTGTVDGRGALVFLHPLWDAGGGGRLAFNVIRLGDVSGDLTVSWALQGPVTGLPGTLSGQVVLRGVAPGTAVDRLGSLASPDARSVVTVDLGLDPGMLPPGLRVSLTGVSGGATPALLGTETAVIAPLANVLRVGTAGNDVLYGGDGNDTLRGLAGNDRLFGQAGNDTLHGGDGADTIIGGDGADLIFGGETAADVRDVIYGGNGNDTIDGGHGNDELRGDAGDDVLIGGFGADTLIGGEGNDRLDGGALGDVLFGGPGNDYFNGGFGFDRLNGGAGADTFFHLGVAGHGSDWIQDYNAAEGDVLQTGIAGATKANFQINIATTPGAGAATVAEAFVIYRPTGQILFALVDGAGQSSINMILGGQVVDLLG